MTQEKILPLTAVLASLLALAMLSIAVATGVSQEYFESVHPVSEYADELVRQAGWLRVVFTLDDFFLLSYSTFFVLFVLSRRDKADPWLLGLCLGALLSAAALDCLENMHILTLLDSAERGVPFSQTHVQLQAIASHFKFALSYLGAILFALVFPRRTIAEKVTVACTGLLYPAVGMLIFTAPRGWVLPLALARIGFYVTAYLCAAAVLWPRGDSARLSPVAAAEPARIS